MLTTILAFALVFGGVVLVHELGHFWIAKLVDIRVERFSIGFGPAITGFRKGETEYVLAWLPLGGYVKMAGMGEEEAMEAIEGPSAEADGEPGAGSDGGAESGSGGEGRELDPRDFEAKPLWARALAIAGGVLMNFLFAVAAFAAIAGIWGVAETPEARIGDVVEPLLPASALELGRIPAGTLVEAVDGERVDDWEELTLALGTRPPGRTTLRLADGDSVVFTLPEDDSARAAVVQALQPVRDVEPLIGQVVEGGPADSAGVRAGDRVVAVDGRPIDSWQAFAAYVESRPGQPVGLTLTRGDTTRTVTVVPATEELATDGDTLRYGRIQVAPEQTAFLAAAEASRDRPGPIGVAAYGANQTWTWTARTVEILGELITGGVSAESLSGPVRIAQMSGQAAEQGPLVLLWWMAVLSINLAILNLLPIPVLDGGHLLFLTIEGVRGRAVSPETRIRWTQLGLLVVLALMVWAIGNDIVHVFGD